jgi:PAS domain S-box-containing protein
MPKRSIPVRNAGPRPGPGRAGRQPRDRAPRLPNPAAAQLAILAHAFQSTNEPICITDLRDRFTFTNRAFQDTYGYTEAEILGQNPIIVFSPRNPPALLAEILARTRAGGWRGEVLDLRKDGTEFPVLLSTSLVRDDQGRVVGLMGVARDISREKLVEKQRAAISDLGYRLSAAAAPEQAAGIILQVASELFGWDAGYFHLYSAADDRIVRLLTMDTIQGQRVRVQPGTLAPAPTPLMRLVMNQGARLINRPITADFGVDLIPFGDLKRRSAAAMYVPVHSAGALVGILSIQSYTPQVYSAEDLHLLQTMADLCGDALRRIRVADALREAEAKYRGIFEHASEGIFQTTPDGRYLSANPALARMFGYPSPAALIAGVPDIAQTYLVPSRRAELKHLLETQAAVQGFEAERRCRDGRTFWISINGHAVRGPDGAVRYYEGTNQDITRIVEARAALARSQEELGGLVRERTAQLEAANQNLRLEMEDRKRLEREVFESIEREQQRMGQDLHDGLCQLLTGLKFKTSSLEARLRQKALPEAAEARALEKLANQAIQQGYGLARGLNPVKLPGQGLPSALADLAAGFEAAFNLRCACEFRTRTPITGQAVANHLYRIAQEAIHNAVKHGHARRITLRLAESRGRHCLTVTDDGTGFRPGPTPQRGMGLQNMRVRASLIGASLTIGLGKKGGTVVTCSFPARGPGKSA